VQEIGENYDRIAQFLSFDDDSMPLSLKASSSLVLAEQLSNGTNLCRTLASTLAMLGDVSKVGKGKTVICLLHGLGCLTAYFPVFWGFVLLQCKMLTQGRRCWISLLLPKPP
jgi:hypothetical protein